MAKQSAADTTASHDSIHGSSEDDLPAGKNQPGGWVNTNDIIHTSEGTIIRRTFIGTIKLKPDTLDKINDLTERLHGSKRVGENKLVDEVSKLKGGKLTEIEKIEIKDLLGPDMNMIMRT